MPTFPCREAWTWLAQHPGTGSATSFAKLLLTLGIGGFSIAKCLHELDEARLDLALRVVNHFVISERDAGLVEIERNLEPSEPRLVALIQSAAVVRGASCARWRPEDC